MYHIHDFLTVIIEAYLSFLTVKSLPKSTIQFNTSEVDFRVSAIIVCTMITNYDTNMLPTIERQKLILLCIKR